jgi:hypothetical protein
VDFLSHFGLLVHCVNNRLLDGVMSPALAQAASTLIPSMKTISDGTPGDNLIAEFPELNHPAGDQREVRQNFVHDIRTILGSQVICRLLRLAPDHLAIAKTVFGAILRDGTARRSESSSSSALHILPKKGNGWWDTNYRATTEH